MSGKKPLITVIGSINIDYVTTTERCPGPGETLTATSLSILTGGKGANQAVGCGKASFISPGRQDVDVEMIGAVGKDDLYVEKLLMPILKESGINIDGIKECHDAQTGTASIVVESRSGQNRIMVVPGANHEGMKQFDEVLGRSVKEGREPSVVVMQGEIPKDTAISLLKHFNANQGSTQVVFNPAPVFPDGVPPEALRGLSTLVVNEGEMILLGRSLRNIDFDMGDVQQEQDLHNEAELSRLCRQFHERLDVQTVLITLGAKGVFFSDAVNGQKGLVPGVKVAEVVDTTAAGDTFIGYFAAELARSSASGSTATFDFVKALNKANEAAAKCVSKAGAMQSIPYGYD